MAVAQTNPVGAGDVAAGQNGPAALPRPTRETVIAPDQLQDIVVTGRKRARAEELQRVPVAITALSAAQLQQSTVRDLVDVGRLTPNASLQSSAQKGVQNFSIRGTGVSGSTPSDEPSVGILQDGVYWGSNYGALNELFDLEGVEILRGPQGTLFGRNVTGGAVSVRSARPRQTPYSQVTLGISNGLGFDATGVVNRPIGDTLSVRLALLSRANQGVYTQQPGNGDYGRNHVLLVRPSVKWKPADNFDVTLLGEYYEADGDPTAVRGVSPRTAATNPVTLAERAGFTSSRDYFATQVGDRGLSDIGVYFAMLDANWQIGPGTLSSVSGYRKVRSRNLTDFDGFPVAGFLQYVATDQHQLSEELRYAADFTDWLSMTAGAYFFDQHLGYAESRDLNNSATRTATRSSLDNDSYAVFAEADIRPMPSLTFTLGGRYTHETKTPIAAPFGACPFTLDAPCTFTTAPTYKGSNFSPKVGLSYQVDPTKLVFASWTRGFRSGGFSLRGTRLGAPYQAETVDAYEVGIKSDFLDRRLRFNVTGFYNTFDNLQRTVLGVDPVLGVVQSVFNAATATIKGAEVEISALPLRGLTLSGTYGFTDARYDSFQGFPNFAALNFVRVPRHTAAAAIDFERPVGDGAKAGFHLGGQYTSRYFFDDPNTLFQNGYALFDANVHYTFATNVTLTAYSRNLTNRNYAVWGSNLGALGQNLFPGEPRTYGLRLSSTF